MKMPSFTIFVSFALAVVTPVVADPVNIFLPSPGYVYFNRPGADVTKHDADLDTCARYVYRQLHIDWDNPADPTIAGFIGSKVNQSIHGGTIASGAAADVENCMVASGWRVVRLPDTEGAELAALSADDLRTRTSPWIGALVPHGTVARAWDNEAAHSSPSDAKAKPSFFQNGQLSWKIHKTAMTGPGVQSEAPPVLPHVWPKIDEKWPIKMLFRSLKLSDVASAPPGSALIILHISGIDLWKARWLSISREGTDLTDRPSLRDHAPDMYGFVEYRNNVQWFIEAVPPGIWRISELNGKILCLGAPAFEVKAGDVIYAGTFDLDSANVSPDLDLAPAKTFLSGTAEENRLKAAEYVNGSRAACGSGMYAYEVPGAPFRPDYAYGSRAPLLTPNPDVSLQAKGQ